MGADVSSWVTVTANDASGNPTLRVLASTKALGTYTFKATYSLVTFPSVTGEQDLTIYVGGIVYPTDPGD